MSFTRKENQTPDESIPYDSFPNKSVYIHGSTYNRIWRTDLINSLSNSEVLLLDPWKTAWPSYVDALQNEVDSFENMVSNEITGGIGGEGTGIVGGYSPPTLPDIENSPYFWENRNLDACSFHFFAIDSNEEVANHVLIQLTAAIISDPTKVVVYIPKAEWRMNYFIFLKNLPRENYFGNFEHAVARLKTLMGI